MVSRYEQSLKERPDSLIGFEALSLPCLNPLSASLKLLQSLKFPTPLPSISSSTSMNTSSPS